MSTEIEKMLSKMDGDIVDTYISEKTKQRIDVHKGEILTTTKEKTLEEIEREKEEKKTHKHYYNDKCEFLKLMKRSIWVEEKLYKYPLTYLVFVRLCRHTQYGTNLILKHNNPYKIKDLAEELKIDRNMASLHFERLEQLNIIKKIDIKRYGKTWVMNPDYCRNGDTCFEIVYNAFNGE